LRNPDPSCNPYLALAGCLAAGLDGIINKIEPPPPCDRNIYAMTAAELEELGIKSMPGSLQEAYAELSKDEVIKEAIGEHIYEKLSEAKAKEWESYSTEVHQWEIDRYLTLF